MAIKGQYYEDREIGKKIKPTDVKLVPNDGDNTKYMAHHLKTYMMPYVDLENEEEISDRVNWYFNQCAEDDMKPTLAGLSLSMGLSTIKLKMWVHEERRKDAAQQSCIVKAYDILTALYEDYMFNGKINPVAGIFMGKNNFGYQDKQEVVVEPKNPLGEISDPAEIQQRYIEDIVDVD